tara:strand:+ start:969 stop:1247 length:279 start_codon:yes stop_codon:yes gene_type:complete
MSSRDHDIKYWDAILQPDGSYIFPNGQIRWYNEVGQNHREDGPSVIYVPPQSCTLDMTHEWTLYDRYYSFNNWCIELNKTDEEKMLLRLQYE